MFDPDGARSDEWAEINAREHRPETGYLENYRDMLGLSIDQYLPFSSSHDINKEYHTPSLGLKNLKDNIFGQSRRSIRIQQINGYIDDETIPIEVKEQYTNKGPRGGKYVNYEGIARWANENLKDDIDHIVTEADYVEDRNAELANRRAMAEDTFSRAGAAGVAGQFVGGMSAMVMDPVTLVTLPLSAPLVGVRAVVGGAQLSRTMYTLSNTARIAAFNVGIQVPMEGFIYNWNEEIGAEYTVKDIMINLAATGTLSGMIGGIGSSLGYSSAIRTNSVGKIIDYASKDRESLTEMFQSFGVPEEEAKILGAAQAERNNSIDNPVEALAEDIVEKVEKGELPDTQHTRNLKEEADEILAKADKKKKKAPKKKAPKKLGKKFDTTKTFYHTNKGGITGGAFDNSRLPDVDPDSPFNAHWFSVEDDIPDPAIAGAAGKKHDTVTPVHLNLSKPATMKDVGNIQKALTVDGKAPTATQLREGLSSAGFTHMAWDGRKPIDAAALEEKGKAKISFNDGSTSWVRKTDDGTYEIWNKDDGVYMQDFDSLDEIIETFPEANNIAMFDAKDIHIIAKEPEVKNPKVSAEEFVGDLESTQADMKARGQEVGDEEPIFNIEDEEMMDKMYDDVPDDLEYYDADGEPIRAKDLVDEYDIEETEIIDSLACLNE